MRGAVSIRVDGFGLPCPRLQPVLSRGGEWGSCDPQELLGPDVATPRSSGEDVGLCVNLGVLPEARKHSEKSCGHVGA